MIDSSVTENCVVLDVYVQSDLSTYDIVEWNYGNIASNFRIIPPPTPSYIDFLEPTNYLFGSTWHIHQWAYFITDSDPANTVLKVVTVDNTTSTHIRENTYNLVGNPYEMVFQNPYCKVLRLTSSGSTSVNAEVAGTYTQLSTLDTVLTGVTISGSTVWQFSEDCTRAQVGDTYIYYTGSAWSRFTLPSGRTIVSVDKNVTVALDDQS